MTPMQQPIDTSPAVSGLSFAEEQLWNAERRGSAALPFFDCAPSLSIVVRLQGPLDCFALEAGLYEIVRRHEVLRSRFVETRGGAVRIYDASLRPGITTIDLRAYGHGDRSDVVTELLAEQVQRPFDLARGPLIRASVITIPGDTHVLAITTHHIVFDRWSRRVLARELEELYAAYTAGRPPVLEPPAAQYRDYVAWQRGRLEGAFGASLVDHWTERLRGLAELALPHDAKPGCAPSARAESVWFTIASTETARVRLLSRRLRVTVATVMLAILEMCLHDVSGSEDIAVGLPLSDRRRPDFEPLIGLFMNVVVVRATVTHGLPFVAVLGRVRDAMVDACRRQDLPYGYLLHVLGARRPLYRVVFNFIPQIPASEVELLGLDVSSMQVPARRESRADLSLHVRDQPDALRCRFVYKADLFSKSRVEDLAWRFEALTASIVDERNPSTAAAFPG